MSDIKILLHIKFLLLSQHNNYYYNNIIIDLNSNHSVMIISKTIWRK